MSEKDREAILDELLTEILCGETEVDVLLERYPEYGPELRELLRTALHIQELLLEAYAQGEIEAWRRVQEAVREKLLAAMEASLRQPSRRRRHTPAWDQQS